MVTNAPDKDFHDFCARVCSFVWKMQPSHPSRVASASCSLVRQFIISSSSIASPSASLKHMQDKFVGLLPHVEQTTFTTRCQDGMIKMLCACEAKALS